MQSDTFLNDTDSDDEAYSSGSQSDGDLPKNNNIGVVYDFPNESIEGERFMDQSLVSNYDKVRRNLFSRQLMKGVIFIDSNNYNVSSDFNTSNYVATFADIKNVIGIHLKSANIRVPQYNVNSTNNVIWYNDGSDHTITINPGYYTVTELAAAFSVTTASHPNKSHRVTYSSGASTFSSVTYYDANSDIGTSGKQGLLFKLINSSSIKILWNHDNITKGAARLLGFNPIDDTSAVTTHYSVKPPDFSQHYVDLCIPEIPGIACKRIIRGACEKNIIDRIPLTFGTGSYQWYQPDIFVTNYFTPIKLNKLNIQLFSEYGEEFDSNNTENSFEFEFTCLCA